MNGVEIQGLAALKAQLQAIAAAATKADAAAAAERIREAAAQNAGSISSRLGGAIVSERQADGSYAVGPDKDHWWGMYLEFGTKQHDNEVRNKLVLASSGQVYGRRVSHPGSTGHPWLLPAFEAAKDDAVEAVRAEVDDATQSAASAKSGGPLPSRGGGKA